MEIFKLKIRLKIIFILLICKVYSKFNDVGIIG